MKRTVALLVALLFLSGLPLGSAQAGLDYVLMGDDPAGDNTNSGTASISEEESPLVPVDMLGLELAEDAEGLHFRLALSAFLPDDSLYNANGAAQQDDSIDFTYFYYRIAFDAMGYTYWVGTNYYVENDAVTDHYAWLGIYDDETGYDFLAQLTTFMNEDDTTINILVDHNDIQDANGRQVRPGDELVDFVVTSFGYRQYAFIGNLYSGDFLPDDGTLPTTWTIQEGVVSSGHIAAWSDLPVRVSNGEATTFLYEVEVANEADHVDTVIPEWDGGNENWIITFPEGKVRLDPGESEVIPFLVTVPFSHEHGSYHPFIVSFQSQADPLSIGRVELGVRYTAIPQPAGHHPSVYLHNSGSTPYFNTVLGEQYPAGAEEEGVGSGFSYECDFGSEAAWVIPLSPELMMGLDFDMDAVGEATFKVTSAYDLESAVFRGFVVVGEDFPYACDPLYDRTPKGSVAVIDPSEPIAMTAEQTTEATSVIRPLESGDYIPYSEGNRMFFILVYEDAYTAADETICCISDTEITFESDTELFLPLSEYHDDVDDFFDRLSGIDLYATTSQERYVNPGEVTVFRAVAQNIGIETTTVELELTGTNLEWVTLVGDDRIRLRPGEEQEIAVAVAAPSGASDEELADVTLHLTDEDDESVRSLIRFLAEVDKEEDHEDEAATLGALGEELQRSPSPFVPALLVVLAIAAMGRRRRN